LRRLVLLVAVLGLSLAACGAEGASKLEGTSWEFDAYSSLETGIVDKVPGTSPTIAFDRDTVSGSDGCNQFSGGYEISSGNMIEIGPLASTRMACEPAVMEQADIILSILDGAFLYEKEDDNQKLFIKDEQQRFNGYSRVADTSADE
jgi:heat shock protein HslJ